jgi:hypothetical protein
VLYRPKRAHRRSLFDLPLGEGHAWTITESEQLRPDDTERFDAVLPAWEAENRHDLLTGPDLGFGDAAAVLVDLVSPEWPDRSGAAQQAARARYTARGFRAAAITALEAAAGATIGREPPTPVPVRHARLRFDRPFAVVAVALADRSAWEVPREAFPWHGIPVFSAWVAEPSEAID